MQDRLRSIGRIAGVQRELQRAAEWKLAAIEQREAALRQTEADLIRFLGQDHAFAGLFPAAMAGRLRSLAREIAQAAQARKAQAATVLRETGRTRRAERLLARITAGERREAEKRELLDIIDRAGKPRKPPVSLTRHTAASFERRPCPSSLLPTSFWTWRGPPIRRAQRRRWPS
jgi:hypothetical protein